MENTTQNQENNNEPVTKYQAGLIKLINIINTIKNSKDLTAEQRAIQIFGNFSDFVHNTLDKNSNLEDFIKVISYAIQNNPDYAFGIIIDFTQNLIHKGKNVEDISTGISQIIQTDGIKTNQSLVFNIVYGFTQGCIIKNKNTEYIGKAIAKIIQTGEIKKDPGLVCNIVDGFTQCCIPAVNEPTYISDTISNIVKDNQDYAVHIAYGFTRGCIFQNKTTEYIGKAIAGVIQTDEIKKDPGLVCDIVDGFTQCCIPAVNEPTYISDTISNIVKDNQDYAVHIAYGFTRGCIFQNKTIKYIGKAIAGVIQTDEIKKDPGLACDIVDGFTQCCISKGYNLTSICEAVTDIIQTVGIKDNPDLAFNIINGFVTGCLMEKPDNIKDTAESFFKLLNEINEDNFGENEQAIKDTLKPIFSSIVSQYFMNTLTDSNNEQSLENNKKTEEQLSEDNKKETDSSNKQLLKGNNKEETETQLFNCYKELFHEENNEKINSFKGISLEELSVLQEEYLEEKFRKKGVNRGMECETFLKMACNLMPKSENNEELTVGKLEKQKDIFKDLKFIRLNNNDNIKSKEELFRQIGLEKNDFGENRKDKDSDFSIVYCAYLGHGFVMIIDKTKGYDDAIKQETESIYLIDSSRYIQNTKLFSHFLLEDKQDIFDSTPTLNDYCYQANDTCWLNAMSAVGFLLEKQQERMPKQNKEQQKQIEQTEQQKQQPRKSYGLSIDDIFEGFGKKRNIINGKIGNITESTTSQEEQSSFEQGICDYSTKHFYPLINHLDVQKYIITNFLAEKVEENIKSQEKLKEMSEQLKKLKEMSERLKESAKKQYEALRAKQQGMSVEEFCEKQGKKEIIYDILGSLKRIAKDENKLKKFCTKFGILDPNQKENSSNKKQSSSSGLGNIASAEGNIDSIYNYPPNSKLCKGENCQAI